MKKKRVLVDMSTTLLHHGHVRLLRKAKKYGKVLVALTTDIEVKNFKGYLPELNFKSRKEIISSIKYVDKVLPSKAKITNNFLRKNKIDIIIRGDDYKKEKFDIKTIIFPRTKNISTRLIRKKAAIIIKNLKK